MRSESSPRSSRVGPRSPRGVTHHAIAGAQVGTVCGRNMMQPHPRGIPDNRVKPTPGRYIRKVTPERERKAAAAPQDRESSTRLPYRAAQLGEPAKLCRRCCGPIQKEVAGSERAEHVTPPRDGQIQRARRQRNRGRTLLAVDGAGERPFANASRARVPAA